jgi:hypothetical protein
MEHLKRAEQAITRATAGDGLQRDAVLDWFEARQKASGEEAAIISETAEALMVAASSAADRRWLQALLDGGPAAAERAMMRQRMQDEAMQFEQPRKDAEEKPEAAPAGYGGLDWGLIAREAKTMVRLNSGAEPAEATGQGQADTEA